MSNNPFTPYAYFPTINSNAPPAPNQANNFCQLLGVEFRQTRLTEEWCNCGECPADIGLKETVCCCDVIESENIWAKNWQKFVSFSADCYSTLPKIRAIIDNKDELDNFITCDQIRLQDKAKHNREIYIDEFDFEEENAKYRFACYRKLTFLVHKKSTFGKRIQLPACVVEYIRNRYPSPSGEYRGYEDNSEEEE